MRHFALSSTVYPQLHELPQQLFPAVGGLEPGSPSVWRLYPADDNQCVTP